MSLLRLVLQILGLTKEEESPYAENHPERSWPSGTARMPTYGRVHGAAYNPHHACEQRCGEEYAKKD